MRIYRYILTSDTGMAPCVDAGLVSLATCKPVIRRCAIPGDWAIGFLASPAPSGMVAWAGRVSRSLAVADYEREFRGRSDAVYRETPGGSFRRLRKDYHAQPGQMETDISGPALLFDPAATWYFGDRPQMLPNALSHLAAQGQGHRVNGVAPDDPARLLAWLRSLGSPGLHGQPPDREVKRPCGPCSAPKVSEAEQARREEIAAKRKAAFGMLADKYRHLHGTAALDVPPSMTEGHQPLRPRP